MLEIAAAIGVCPLTFWQITPGELSIMVEAYNRKRKEDHEEKLIVAYLGAYWQRVKKMPSIKEYLGQEEKKNKKNQTVEDMLNEIKKLNAALGGTVY